jgi:hypothetical protein
MSNYEIPHGVTPLNLRPDCRDYNGRHYIFLCLINVLQTLKYIVQTLTKEDIKVVIRNRKSKKDRQHNGKEKKGLKDKHITQNSKYRTTKNYAKIRG